MSDNDIDDDEPPEPGKGDESYEVGYGKPPRHTQFKPGNKSGKGRPKCSKNLGTIVNEALGVKVAAKINGKQKKMTKVELSMHQLANKASAGDLKAIAKVIELYEMHGPQEEVGQISEGQAEYDLETIIHHLKISGKLPLDDEDEEEDDE